MEKIETSRSFGYLDLNAYFAQKLKTSLFTLEDLYENGLIEFVNEGINDKFWILSKEGEFLALFKSQLDFSQPYAELMAEEICKILEIRTAHYDLATFNGEKGVISYNIFEDTYSYDSGFDMISTFYEDRLLNHEDKSKLYGIDDDRDSIEEVLTRLNNLDGVWAILEEEYKGYPNKQRIISTIVAQLVNVLLFDILTINVDRHCDNWGIVNEKRLAPIFDNERCLGLYKKRKDLQDKVLLFTVDDSGFDKPAEALSHFLDISSSEYKDRVAEKITLLQDKMDDIPSIIEQRTAYPMPEDIKNNFLTTMHVHLEKMSHIVEEKNKKHK